MNITALIYLSPLLATGLISLGSIFYLNKNFERTKALRILNIVLIILTVWIIAYALELASVGLSKSAFWENIQFIELSILPVFWFAFALEYTGQTEWANKRNMLLLLIIPIESIVLLWTNSYHHLFYESLILKEVGPLSAALNEGQGLVYWLFGAYGYSLLIIGAAMIIFRLINLGEVYYKQAMTLAIAFSLPVMGNILFTMAGYMFPIYNPTPVLIAVAILVLVWNVTKFRFLDIMPLARTTVFEKIQDAILVLDKQSRIVDLNNPAEELVGKFGQTSKNPLGEKLGKIFPIDVDLAPSEEKYTNAIEIELTQDEKAKVFELEEVPLRGVENQYIGAAVILKDITERREAEEREQFLHSLLRHDVGNKLQVSRGFLELFLDDADLSPDEFDRIEESLRSIEKAVDLMDKVKFLREIEDEEIEEIKIDFFVQEAIEGNRSRASDKDIQIEYDKCGLNVKGGSLVKTLFSNLIENSILHSECDKIKINAEEEEKECIITVEDDGKGIPEEERQKIFKKGYKSGKTAGSGLGMYIVKRIAEGYNGSIEVSDSELGGVRFKVHLKKA